MELNVLERAMALGLLPETGDFGTLRTIQDMRNKLSLSEDEVKEFNFKIIDEGKKMTWNTEGNKDRDVELSEGAIEILRNKLKELNDKKELTTNHMSLYTKVVK